MTVRQRSATRSGSILVLAGLVAAAGCAARRPHQAVIPRPLRLQTAVAVDKQGNEILVGSFAGRLRIAGAELTSAGGTDAFLAKNGTNGAAVFPPMRFGGTGDDAATGVAVDDDGSIVVSGTFQGEATFGSQTLKAEVRHPLQRAVFVARLDPAGKLEWVKQIAVANAPTQISVAVRPDHSILVGASGSGTVANRTGSADLVGESIVLDLLSAKGDFIPQPDNVKIRALSSAVLCAHSACSTGGFLTAGCGPDDCVAAICNADPYCCTVAWDSICVGEVGSVCQRRCDCGTICTQGIPFYPLACTCTGIVFNGDAYCGETWWDAICINEAVSWCHITCP
jgi:hypothetical protein